MNTRRFLVVSTAACLPAACWCAPAHDVTAQVAARASGPTQAEVVRHYARLVSASYSDALAAARQMQQAIAALLAAPSPATLGAARDAWRAAREPYGQTEAFRFYAGPIDDGHGPEERLNAWPVDESYLDYVLGKPGAGLVNDPGFALSKANLAKFNERGGEENVCTGWHAIEFLLWGQDRSETGPGDRPHLDYVDGETPNAARRRRCLGLITELLIDDLSTLVEAWAPGRRNYRAHFERGGRESLRKIIVGLGSLSRGELAGERLDVPLHSQDQEDEQSCFSDNTHRDIVNNVLGIQNVWLGRLARLDGSLLQGPSLQDLVAAVNPALAERTTAQVSTSLAAAQALQPPFDREIIGGKAAPGRQRVEDIIQSLIAQSKLLVDAAAALGITRLTLVQP